MNKEEANHRYQLYRIEKSKMFSIYEDINNGTLINSSNDIKTVFSLITPKSLDVYSYDIFDTLENIWIFEERLNSITTFLSSLNITRGGFAFNMSYVDNIFFALTHKSESNYIHDVMIVYNTLSDTLSIKLINETSYPLAHIKYSVSDFIKNHKELKPFFRKGKIDDLI